MRAMNRLLAGGLLAALGLATMAGTVARADADAPPAPREHGWGPGDGAPGGGPGERGPEDRCEHGGMWHGHGMHHHFGPMAQFHELGLTDAQHASIKSILETAKPAMEEIHNKMRANAKQLHEMTPDDKNFGQVAAKVSQENGVLVGKLLALHAKVYADSYAVLAPIQKIKLAEIRARREKWMEEHKQWLEEHKDRHEHDGEHGGSHPPSADDEGMPDADNPEV